MADRLYRSRDDRMLAGVAAGVADELDLDPSLVRIVWALLAIFTGGIAFVVYIVMAIVVPERPAGWEHPTPDPWTPMPGAPASPGSPVAPIAPAPPIGTEGAAPTAPSASTEPTAPFTAPSPTATSSPPTYWVSDREARRAARRARRAGEPGRAGLLVGFVLILVGGAFLVREFVPWFDWSLWWPIGLIALGGLLLAVALLPGRDRS